MATKALIGAAALALSAVPEASDARTGAVPLRGLSAAWQSTGHTRMETTPMDGHVLVDFAKSGETDRWKVVNDGVMGRSQSRLVAASDTTAVFEGTLSLENNGGFASVRRAPGGYDMAGAGAIEIVVNGDGRRYQFRVQTNDGFDGVAYRAFFDTAPDAWLRIEIPFDAFEASFRGRLVPDAPMLDPADIRQLGLLLADKRPGAFRLELRSILARSSGQLRHGPHAD